MSKSEQKDVKVWETKQAVFERDGWQCVYVYPDTGHRCIRQATQLAHILPQDKLHLSLYGEAVIHHPLNMRGTCPEHNASVQINFRSRPMNANAHAAAVRKAMEAE